MSLHLQSLDFPIHQNSNFRKMAYRIDFPIVRCPSTQPLFAAVHHRKHLFTSNLAPRSTSNLRISSTFHSNKKLCNRSKGRSRILSVSGATTTEQMPVTEGRMLVFVPPHPLIKHWVSILRNEQTPPPVFRSAMGELGRLLIYEASRDWLPTITGEIQSPMGVASVEFVDPREPVAIVPILRAGLALAEHASSVLPATKTYHLGMSRDEETLQPSVYLNKLPDEFADGSRVIILDPMLATGGTIVAALELITNLGVDNKHIKVVCALTAPPALKKLSEKFPGLHVYAGMIDPEVNEKGFIIPGFGDAGDRSFAT